MCRVVPSGTDSAPRLSIARCNPFQLGPSVFSCCSVYESRYTDMSGMRQWGDWGDEVVVRGRRRLADSLPCLATYGSSMAQGLSSRP